MKLLTAILTSTLLLLTTDVICSVKQLDVEVEGQGTTLQSAINSALVEAVSQVKGKAVSQVSELKNLQVNVGINDEEKYFASDRYKNQVRTATAGVISSYEVLNKNKDVDGSWDVLLLVKVSDYKNKTSSRKRIAVLPFYVSSAQYPVADQKVSASKITRMLNQQLVDYLVQSRKFSILDRDYVSRTASELSLSRSQFTSVDELARLGETLVADYVLVGTLEGFYANITERNRIIGEGKIKSIKNNIHVSYRLIETATSQVVVSDSLREVIPFDYLQNSDGTLSQHSIIYGMTEIFAKQMSGHILSQIYPILVTKVDGDLLTLGQGGKSLVSGQRYKVYQYGDIMYDPYTKEYLGRSENYCCEVTITRVEAKQSWATLVSQNIDIAQQFKQKKFVLREQAPEHISNSASAKVKSRRAELREQMQDDNW